MSYPEIYIRVLFYDFLLWILMKRRRYFSLNPVLFLLKIRTFRIRLQELHQALIKNQKQHPRFLVQKESLRRHIHRTLLYLGVLLQIGRS